MYMYVGVEECPRAIVSKTGIGLNLAVQQGRLYDLQSLAGAR